MLRNGSAVPLHVPRLAQHDQRQLSAEEHRQHASGARLQDCLSNMALYLALFFACLFGLVALLLAALRRLRNAVTPAAVAAAGEPPSPDRAGSDCGARSAVEMDDLAATVERLAPSERDARSGRIGTVRGVAQLSGVKAA